jgi:hypothetical protein
MSRTHKIKQCFRVNIAKIEGEGEFPCPSCGTIISPDDYSGLTYEILEVKTKAKEEEEVFVQCGVCGCVFCIVGFDLLKQTGNSDEL